MSASNIAMTDAGVLDTAPNPAVTENLAALELAASKTGGSKIATIVRNGCPAYWTLAAAVRPLWAPSVFKAVGGDTGGRMSLCATGNAATMAEAAGLDQWAQDYALEHSVRFFGKDLTREQVADRYLPIVKKNDQYPPFLKIKVGHLPSTSPMYWDETKKQREPPASWTNCDVQCRARILGFWFMSTQFGLTVQLTDCQVFEQAMDCPF